MTGDEKFMQRCLELARLGLENGDAPVGSLIAIKSEIIAEGIEAVKSKRKPTAHAEIEVVRSLREIKHARFVGRDAFYECQTMRDVRLCDSSDGNQQGCFWHFQQQSRRSNCPFFSFRAPSKTLIPCLANSRAVPKPMPRFAPETNAIFRFCKLILFSLS